MKIDVVKSLEKISKEVCKDLPEKNYKVGLLSTSCFAGTIDLGHIPTKLGIYTSKGFLFKKLDKTYALISLREIQASLAGVRVKGELGNEEYLKKCDLGIHSPDEKILNLFKEKIDNSELKGYLDEKQIQLKRYLEDLD